MKCLERKISQFLNIHRKTSVLSLFTQVAGLQFCNFIKNRIQHRCFSVNIAKLLKTPILNKICKRLFLNNVKRNYSSMKNAKQVLNVSQHSSEKTFTGVSFLINITWHTRKRGPRTRNPGPGTLQL